MTCNTTRLMVFTISILNIATAHLLNFTILKTDDEHVRNLGTCGNNICDINESVESCFSDCVDLSLDGADSGKWGANGIMFKTVALRDIAVNWLHYHSWEGGVNQTVQVYTRRGLYMGYHNNSDGWDLVYDETLVSKRRHESTVVEFDTPVIIEANATQSFYIHAENSLLFDQGTSEGVIYSNNSELELYYGRAKLGLFRDWFQQPFALYGRIGYDVIYLTPEPSAQPSPTPSRLPSSSPSQIPSPEPSVDSSDVPLSAPSNIPSIYCRMSKSRISVRVKTDRNGKIDNSWKFFDDFGNVLASRELGTFNNNSLHDDEVCISRCTNVTFIFYDEFGDGLLDIDNGYFSVTFFDGLTDPIIGGNYSDVGPKNFKEKIFLIKKDQQATCEPSLQPSLYPSLSHSPSVASEPSTEPTDMPSRQSNTLPSFSPTIQASFSPTTTQTTNPSNLPTTAPSKRVYIGVFTLTTPSPTRSLLFGKSPAPTSSKNDVSSISGRDSEKTNGFRYFSYVFVFLIISYFLYCVYNVAIGLPLNNTSRKSRIAKSDQRPNSGNSGNRLVRHSEDFHAELVF